MAIINGIDKTSGHIRAKSLTSISGNVQKSTRKSSTNEKKLEIVNEIHQDEKPPTPIAICGMALRLPGGINNPEQFWEFLLAKRDGRTKVPESRYNISSYHSTSGNPGTIKTEYGYFLDTELGNLDTSFFSMTRTELERIDPQQRQLLEVTRECFENAGETNWKGKDIGCYVGSFGEDWAEIFSKEPQQFGLWRVTGYGDFALSNRISYEWDLKGPSMTIRTGCSSSMIALHEACQAIERKECSSAIVGGANLIMAPGMTAAMTEQGVLSPDGNCKSFDISANGYARGEAINAIYIKPLSQAIRDGNPIRAIIRSTSTNCDGKTPGISCPSSESHEAMIRRAYKVAQIHDISKTGFVECHGTGTPIGDPLETNAVARIFSDRGVYIGSVKPNVGHSEGASGITSIIKTVLALENKTIPPNIKFIKANPKIPIGPGKLQVPTEAIPWPRDRNLRASVNSFGIGGANGHVILDAATKIQTNRSEKLQLLVYSANSQEALRKQISNIQNYLERHPENLSSLSYTLGVRREHLPHRAFSIIGPNISNISPLTKTKTASKIAMIFTGQGAQWPQMGGELFENSTFRKSIEQMNETLQKLPNPPKWSIENELMKSETSQLHSTEFAQPLGTALQIGLIDCFRVNGINPDCVVGHSSGEIAAAYASGALTSSEAIIVAYYRGVFTKLQAIPGGMAAIGLGWNDTSKYLLSEVVIACENSPNSVTISGDDKQIDIILKSIKKDHPEILARKLKVEMAYHSPYMKAAGKSYNGILDDKIFSKSPKVRFYSSVTGNRLISESALGPHYWRQNLESPVLFRTAIEKLIQDEGQNIVFLEIGPHSALAGPLRQILTNKGVSSPYIPAMIREKHCGETLLSAIGQSHLQGISINFKAITSGHVLTDLPPYPWDHDTSYWYESRLSKDWRFRKFPQHDLLGIRILESTDSEPSWRNLFHLDNAPWIRDHKIREDVIFPFAAYVGMIGEAIGQLTGNREGFILRHVVVSTALLLHENKPTEIITSIRKHRLTDSLDSQWWEFSISSQIGGTWTKHCTGQAKSQNYNIVEDKIIPFPRHVQTSKWYETMRKVGLNYGPTFQGLEEITASTTKQSATAKSKPTLISDQTKYLVHPTAIDLFLQLFSTATSKGISRGFQKMAVPTNVEEVVVYHCNSQMEMEVSAISTLKGAIWGEGKCISNGKLVLKMSGAKLSPLEDTNVNESIDTHAGARLEWQQDIDFMEVGQLIKPSIDRKSYSPILDELLHLCQLETLRDVINIIPKQPYLEKFRVWLAEQIILKNNSKQNSDRPKRILQLFNQLSKTPAKPLAIAMMRVLRGCKDIFKGTQEPLEILLADDTLTKLYNFVDECNRTEFIKHIAHSKPNLRVLEIGAGTGGTTNSILSELKSYSKYTFTDISAGFFSAAKERFKSFPNIEFATLDIGKDPIEQGFEKSSYDLILASNVLHATPSLHETLCNVRKLLRPDGRLLLQELCSDIKILNYIMGILPGWWLGDGDERYSEPYIMPKRWELELKKAGFNGLDSVTLDEEQPYQINAIMVARPRRPTEKKKNLTLLCQSQSRFTEEIARALLDQGYQIFIRKMGDPLPIGQDVLSILDVENPFFENINAEDFQSFKNVLHAMGENGMLWLSRSSQMVCQDPRYGQTIGTMRSIRYEMSIDIATCEIDDIEFCFENVVKIVEKFTQRHQVKENLRPEFEYAITNGKIYIGRYYPFTINEELTTNQSDSVVALDITRYGRLNTLSWRQKESSVLIGDEVEIETMAVGMNFKDVLIAMGIVDESKRGFGLEAAGIIRQIGPDVKDLKVGDRVIALGPGCFSTFLAISSQQCAKMSDNLNFEDGATMPCVYATVIYSLIDVGHLESGQSILIHSACGGVGIAAIQIASMLGAEIYVTVGNDEKVEYLMSTFHLPRNRIFNSRDTSFLPELMNATKGKGVDLVLNSLSGELLHTSWQCVAEFGKLVEIGKRDLIGFGKLNMDIFESNRSYCGVDLGQICSQRKKICNRLLRDIMKYFDEGHILPIRPTKIFDATSVQDCFRYMQKGQHIGKIVVSMSNTKELEIEKSIKILRLDLNASYLLVGGLGGLGKTVSTWMIENGARNLIYLSRSAGKSLEDQTFFKELESQGCSIQAISGDVTIFNDVEKAVAMASKPLKGIIQMSMVLADESFPEMKIQDWNKVIAPKVKGTWNLHNASKDASLDFFIFFSSISGTIGQAGQANYASANTFLDSFARYRHGLRVPASSIDIGVVEDSGFVAQNTALMKKLRTSGAYIIGEQEFLDGLKLAITDYQHRDTEIVLGLRSTIPLEDPNNRSVWRKDRRMAFYHNEVKSLNDQQTAENDKLKEFLQSAAATPEVLKDKSSAVFLATEIGKKIFNFLLKSETELDISQKLENVGMDSLIAIEIRSWWNQIFGFDISVLEMLGMGSIELLGQHCADGLFKKLTE